MYGEGSAMPLWVSIPRGSEQRKFAKFNTAGNGDNSMHPWLGSLLKISSVPENKLLFEGSLFLQISSMFFILLNFGPQNIYVVKLVYIIE